MNIICLNLIINEKENSQAVENKIDLHAGRNSFSTVFKQLSVKCKNFHERKRISIFLFSVETPFFWIKHSQLKGCWIQNQSTFCFWKFHFSSRLIHSRVEDAKLQLYLPSVFLKSSGHVPLKCWRKIWPFSKVREFWWFIVRIHCRFKNTMHS